MTPSRYLLDSGVLIALVVQEHEHHEIVARWVSGVERFALCPITEGALVRFLVRIGEGSETAAAILREMYRSSSCVFWADALSYQDADLDHVIGFRQVTDAYLGSLARSHNALVATFDHGFAQAMPDDCLLIPTGTDG